MADLKKGDIVRLKSGGPKMTVEHVETDEDGNARLDHIGSDDNLIFGLLFHLSPGWAHLCSMH